MGKFLLGLVIGLLVLPAAVWAWLQWGHPPVTVADKPLPFEREIVHVPLHARIDHEMPQHAAMDASQANLLLGAGVYRQQCASCHGLYGQPSDFGGHMYPRAPQLWAPHGNGVVGVSDDPVGETYWKVKNGIRLSGMPAFGQVLSEAQMWQVSLLLSHAASPLPDGVLQSLQQPLFAPATQAAAPGTPAAPTAIPVQPLPNE